MSTETTERPVASHTGATAPPAVSPAIRTEDVGLRSLVPYLKDDWRTLGTVAVLSLVGTLLTLLSRS